MMEIKKVIKVSIDVYEELKELALPYMEPEDTVNDAIEKVIRIWLEKCKDVVRGPTEPTIEGVLERIPEPYRHLAKEIIEGVRNFEKDALVVDEEVSVQRVGIEITLPSDKAWREGYRWITFKKEMPRGRRKIIGWIEPRNYGFLIGIYDPSKKRDIKLRIGKDQEFTVTKIGDNRYKEIKNKILSMLKKAFEAL